TKRKFLKGFLSLLQDEHVPFRTIFFTFSGIQYRHEVRHIGKILQDKGLVTSDHVDDALKIQEKLHSRRIGEIIAETAALPQEHIENSIQEASRKPETQVETRVGDILIEAGIVTREQVETAYQIQQRNKKVKMGALLISQGLIT